MPALKKEVFFRLLLVLGVLFFPWFFFQSSQALFQGRAHPQRQPEQDRRHLPAAVLQRLAAEALRRSFLDLLKKAGTESLFVYVLHLFVIFNSFFRRG